MRSTGIFIWTGKVPVAKLLLQYKADASRVGKNGWLPLHLAARRGNVEMVQILLDAGADPAQTFKVPNKKHSAGSTAYDVAVDNNRDDAAALLKKHREIGS